MASTALPRRIPSPALSTRQISRPMQHSRAIVGVSQSRYPQLRLAGNVVSVRGFAGEGGASEKDEASSAGENGKSGAAVADSSSSPPGGSTKGFGASARPGAAKAKDKKKAATIRRSAPEKPLLQSAPADNQISQLETVYVASLATLLGLIFVEGIALAASGARAFSTTNPNS